MPSDQAMAMAACAASGLPLWVEVVCTTSVGIDRSIKTTEGRLGVEAACLA